jgi:CHAD domain-containing protein/transposase
MVRMSTIPLTEDQKIFLEGLAKSDPSPVMHRAMLILAYGEGKPTMQAAQQAGISRGRARHWKRQFLSRGMAIFTSEDFERKHPEEAQIDQESQNGADTSLVETSQEIKAQGNVISDLPYPLVQKNIGLTPEDSLAAAGRKVWLFHFAYMLSHEQGTLEGKDLEELHDMRVATRRMRSAFGIFQEAYDPKTMKRFLKGLRGIGKALGEVRDLDVILVNGLNYQNQLPEEVRHGLDPLILGWKDLLRKKRIKLTKHLHSDAYTRFKTEFNQFLQNETSGNQAAGTSIDANASIRDIVPVLIYTRYARVRAYDTILAQATISQLHALRIEFKKFRYALEYFKEILGDGTAKAINEIKQYQDHLGELHDADVACLLLSDFLKHLESDQQALPIQTRVNPEQVVNYLASQHAERYRLMVSFPEKWSKFNRPEFRQNLAQVISSL